MIITTPEKEKETIKLWFKEGGRDIEEYERIERTDEAINPTIRGIVV